MALVCEEDECSLLRIALPVAVGHRYPLFTPLAAEPTQAEAAAAEAACEERAAIAEGARGAGLHRFSLDVALAMPCAVRAIECPSNDGLVADVDACDATRAHASLALPAPPPTEMVLTVQLAQPMAPRCWLEPWEGALPDAAAQLPDSEHADEKATHDEADMDGASDGTAASHAPPARVAALAVLHPDSAALHELWPTPPPAEQDEQFEFVFVIDRSGSMDWGGGGEARPIRRAAAALQLFLCSLPPNCKFNIVGFGSNHECLFPSPKEYCEASLRAASDHAAALRADLGGTELTRPLAALLATPPADGYARRLIVITDGSVSNTEHVLELVREKTQPRARTVVHTVGIGEHVSHALVDGLADAGGGSVGNERMRMPPR
jgi:hypothetical protein